MVMLAQNYEYVIGGDPDLDTIDLAVLDTATGRVRAHLAGAADGAGYRRMLARGLARTLRADGSGHWKERAASPPGCSCACSTRAKRSSTSVRSSGPVEQRTIASTPSARLARHRPATSRAHPDLAFYGKPRGWYSLAGKEFL
jgi:hypothetical protein